MDLRWLKAKSVSLRCVSRDTVRDVNLHSIIHDRAHIPNFLIHIITSVVTIQHHFLFLLSRFSRRSFVCSASLLSSSTSIHRSHYPRPVSAQRSHHHRPTLARSSPATPNSFSTEPPPPLPRKEPLRRLPNRKRNPFLYNGTFATYFFPPLKISQRGDGNRLSSDHRKCYVPASCLYIGEVRPMRSVGANANLAGDTGAGVDFILSRVRPDRAHVGGRFDVPGIGL